MDDISQITRLKYHFIYFSKNNCDPHSGYLGRGSMFILNQRTLFHSNRKPAENWENSQAKVTLSLFLLSYVLSSIKIQYSPEHSTEESSMAKQSGESLTKAAMENRREPRKLRVIPEWWCGFSSGSLHFELIKCVWGFVSFIFMVTKLSNIYFCAEQFQTRILLPVLETKLQK